MRTQGANFWDREGMGRSSLSLTARPAGCAKLAACSKDAEEWAAASMAGAAMRRSRRAFGCGLDSTRNGRPNGNAQKMKFLGSVRELFSREKAR